jgi:hypothetical protein
LLPVQVQIIRGDRILAPDRRDVIPFGMKGTAKDSRSRRGRLIFMDEIRNGVS